jgi:hypothetical protein
MIECTQFNLRHRFGGTNAKIGRHFLILAEFFSNQSKNISHGAAVVENKITL